MNRRSFLGFLGKASAAAASVAAMPGQVFGDVSVPLPKTHALDPLTMDLYRKKLTVDAIMGDYANRFMGDYSP